MATTPLGGLRATAKCEADLLEMSHAAASTFSSAAELAGGGASTRQWIEVVRISPMTNHSEAVALHGRRRAFRSQTGKIAMAKQHLEIIVRDDFTEVPEVRFNQSDVALAIWASLTEMRVIRTIDLESRDQRKAFSKYDHDVLEALATVLYGDAERRRIRRNLRVGMLILAALIAVLWLLR
jgi:hypothetical protein